MNVGTVLLGLALAASLSAAVTFVCQRVSP